jgi:putative DNA primase/helicase
MIRAMADLASPVSAFLRDRCVRSAELQTEQKRLYEAFGQWHADQGRDGRKITKNRFTRELATVGVSAGQSRIHEDLALDRVWVYRGVGLRSP